MRELTTKILVTVAARMRPGRDLDDVETATKFALRSVARRHLVHLQDRFWAMSCSAAYESAERTTRSLVNAHKASLSITQKVS